MGKRYEKEIKKYILKNKNENVLMFDFNKIIDTEDFNKVVEYKFNHIKFIREDLLPKGYLNIPNSNILEKWIESRKVPKNRENVNAILGYYSNENKFTTQNIMNYIDISFGLSFNDSYWIVPEEKSDLLWENFNLYKNQFSEILGLVAFGETVNSLGISNDIKTSPEYTTNGMLAKCWTTIDDTIFLLKKSSKYHNIEAYAEYYTSQIAEIMGFSYVPYNLIKFHDHIVSACPIFTSEDEGYIPIHLCLKKEDVREKKKEKLLKEIEKIIGYERLADIMLFDSIIYNTDRHLGNFGMIMDNNTTELLRAAPIFDNGNCIFNLFAENAEQIYYKNYTSKIEIDFEDLSKMFVEERHCEGLEKLKKFKFIRHKEYNLSEEILMKVENFIQERSKAILKQLEKKLELKNEENSFYKETIRTILNEFYSNDNCQYYTEQEEIEFLLRIKKILEFQKSLEEIGEAEIDTFSLYDEINEFLFYKSEDLDKTLNFLIDNCFPNEYIKDFENYIIEKQEEKNTINHKKEEISNKNEDLVLNRDKEIDFDF